ncbi:hypothetical protein G6F32_014729 [Rhizopus arrhizus]|nr:hypothetical protein G6F32_014729 [Rhizopus arrhizus]
MAGAGRPYGVDPLSRPVVAVHLGLLPLRTGQVRDDAAQCADAVRAAAVCRAGRYLARVAAPLPLRAHGVVVACDDLPAVAADAARSRAGLLDAEGARGRDRGRRRGHRPGQCARAARAGPAGARDRPGARRGRDVAWQLRHHHPQPRTATGGARGAAARVALDARSTRAAVRAYAAGSHAVALAAAVRRTLQCPPLAAVHACTWRTAG